MQSSGKINNGHRGARGGAAAEADRLARLASYAIERGHANTLRRHLASGLNPDSMFHHRSEGPGPWTLIETAARRGQLECLKVLEAAGALITEDAILCAVLDPCDQVVLAHLLASKTFNPRAVMESGRPWRDCFDQCSPETAAILAQAVSELERAELDSAAAPSIARRPRRL
ncbi:hypothetical protein [Massilia sp. TSP1-1-2]|uniref:hypothetical protein n=1 Tax=Massilia sp. TSP1-1-2 TaxID=2804649 RepID=UPI003CF163EB